MSITRQYRALVILLILSLLAVPVVEAAGLGLTMHQIDSSQFPKVRGYVSVANDQGVRIADLEQDPQAFALLEDDKPIADFQVEPIIASQEPVAIALVMDVSGSMNDEGKLEAAKQAAAAFVDTMSNRDGAAVIGFSKEVKVVQTYGSDKAALKTAIGGLKADGATLLYDAVADSAALMGFVQVPRKVLLLLTDGENEPPVGLPHKNVTLDSAIEAATAAKTPVFAVGLGSGVKKDVLDKLAANTGGQAIYVARGDQLKQAFLSLGDQLRRQYVFTYTSKLPADDKQHTLTVKAQYRGQTGEAQGTFVAGRTPLAFEIKGLANAAQVSGAQRIEVTVTKGTAQQIELLVDDQPRGTATAAPFVLVWDTSKEQPGLRRLVVRAKDAAGATADKELVVSVVGAAQAATTAPTVVPTAVPTVVAKPVPAPPASDNTLYIVGGLLALALIGGGVTGFLLLRKRKVVLPAAPPPTKPVDRSDRTEDMGVPIAPSPKPVETPPLLPGLSPGATIVSGGASAMASGGATMVSGPPAPPRPRARLRIVHQGVTREVVIEQPETILGREESNPVVIKDALASRRHARITIENGEFWIEDLKSLNGTLVNGQLITKCKLSSDDRVNVGSAVLMLIVER